MKYNYNIRCNDGEEYGRTQTGEEDVKKTVKHIHINKLPANCFTYTPTIAVHLFTNPDD